MADTDPLATLNPAVIGQAEKAHNAVLDRVLAGTALDEHRWITLQLALATGPVPRTELATRVTTLAKFSATAVHEAISGLAAAGLIHIDQEDVAVTTAGRSQVHALRQRVGSIIGPAYASVSVQDREVAARVLSQITGRLNVVLAGN